MIIVVVAFNECIRLHNYLVFSVERALTIAPLLSSRFGESREESHNFWNVLLEIPLPLLSLHDKSCCVQGNRRFPT